METGALMVPPPSPGTYVLCMVLDRDTVITAGSLGALALEAGLWLYVGSALGPGGLRARVGRHLGRRGKRHWHVDHLLAEAQVPALLYAASPRRLEHRWAGRLAARKEIRSGPPGFGSSDCGCATHLFQARRLPDPGELEGGSAVQVRRLLFPASAPG